MTTSNHHVAEHPILQTALTWDPADSTLSSGEAALARIMAPLADDIHLLDGRQLTAVQAWITAVTDTTVEAEAVGRAMLDPEDEPQS